MLMTLTIYTKVYTRVSNWVCLETNVKNTKKMIESIQSTRTKSSSICIFVMNEILQQVQTFIYLRTENLGTKDEKSDKEI